MIEKYKKTCKQQKYVEYLLIFISTITDGVSISAFASLVCDTQICAITAGIKKYESIIQKKKKQHDEIALLGKSKLDPIEVLISTALTDSYVSNDKFVSINKTSLKHTI